MSTQEKTFQERSDLIREYEAGKISAKQFLDKLLGDKFVHHHQGEPLEKKKGFFRRLFSR